MSEQVIEQDRDAPGRGTREQGAHRHRPVTEQHERDHRRDEGPDRADAVDRLAQRRDVAGEIVDRSH